LKRGRIGEIVKQHVAFGLLVADDCPVVVIDIPVQFNKYFFVLVDIGGGKDTGIKAVLGLENADGLVNIGLCDTDNVFDGLGIGRPRGFEFFIIDKEKQLVLDDRPARK